MRARCAPSRGSVCCRAGTASSCCHLENQPDLGGRLQSVTHQGSLGDLALCDGRAPTNKPSWVSISVVKLLQAPHAFRWCPAGCATTLSACAAHQPPPGIASLCWQVCSLSLAQHGAHCGGVSCQRQLSTGGREWPAPSGPPKHHCQQACHALARVLSQQLDPSASHGGQRPEHCPSGRARSIANWSGSFTTVSAWQHLPSLLRLTCPLGASAQAEMLPGGHPAGQLTAAT